MSEHRHEPRRGDLTRIYDAPRELVFRCMTEPEHLAHFWGPVGVTTPVENITIDLRPGGAFETIMVNDADGDEYPMKAVYVEIAPPERIVLTEPEVEGGMTTTITFRTSATVGPRSSSTRPTCPRCTASPEAQAGMQSSFDKFEAYVSESEASSSAARPGPATGLPVDSRGACARVGRGRLPSCRLVVRPDVRRAGPAAGTWLRPGGRPRVDLARTTRVTTRGPPDEPARARSRCS